MTLSASAGVQFILEPNVEFADAQHGSGESLLTDFSRERYAFPRWAPDGKKIAVVGYVSQANPNMAVVTVATRKVQMVQLPGHLSVSAAAWEPDSQSLIYMQPETAGADSSSTTAGIFCQAPGGAARKTAWSPAFGIVLDLLPPNRVVFGARRRMCFLAVNCHERPVIAVSFDPTATKVPPP